MAGWRAVLALSSLAPRGVALPAPHAGLGHVTCSGHRMPQVWSQQGPEMQVLRQVSLRCPLQEALLPAAGPGTTAAQRPYINHPLNSYHRPTTGSCHPILQMKKVRPHWGPRTFTPIILLASCPGSEPGSELLPKQGLLRDHTPRDKTPCPPAGTRGSRQQRGPPTSPRSGVEPGPQKENICPSDSGSVVCLEWSEQLRSPGGYKSAGERRRLPGQRLPWDLQGEAVLVCWRRGLGRADS